MEITGESAGAGASPCVRVGNKHQPFAGFQIAIFSPVFVVVLP